MRKRGEERMEEYYEILESALECVSKEMNKLDMLTTEFDVLVSKCMDSIHYIGEVCDECATHLDYLKKYMTVVYRVLDNEKSRKGMKG